MSMMADEKVLPFLKAAPVPKPSNLTPNGMPKRKRVSDIKKLSSTSTPAHKIHRKRAAEPRPHPPDCLNKRYWDDVRAGRIPEPTWTSYTSAEPLQKSPKNSKIDPKPTTPSTRPILTPTSIMPQFPPLHIPFSGPPRAPGMLPPPGMPLMGMSGIPPMLGQISPFPPGAMPPMPFMGMPHGLPPFFFDPNVFSSGGDPKVNMESEQRDDKKSPSTSGTVDLTLPNPFHASTSNQDPCSSSSSTSSDDQIDIIADALLSEVARRSQQVQAQPKDGPKPDQLPGNLCIIPIPVPILIPLPLTPEFIMKYFSSNIAKKML